jgi:hypothetical protein
MDGKTEPGGSGSSCCIVLNFFVVLVVIVHCVVVLLLLLLLLLLFSSRLSLLCLAFLAHLVLDLLAFPLAGITLQTITPDHSFPPEFQSRSNYLQLLQELGHIYRYEPGRMAQLWHAAWVHERRRELLQLIRRARDNIRAGRTEEGEGGENGDDQADADANIETGAIMLSSALWGATFANSPVTTTTPTMIQLSLKTKRFEEIP